MAKKRIKLLGDVGPLASGSVVDVDPEDDTVSKLLAQGRAVEDDDAELRKIDREVNAEKESAGGDSPE